MRLDVFLKLSRLISKRTLAKEFTKKGLVKVNSVVSKASYAVKAGDEIEIKSFSRVLRVKVLEIPAKKQVSKQAAKGLYEVLSEERIENDLLITKED